MNYLKMDGPYSDYGRPNMWNNESKIKCCVDTHTRDAEDDPKHQVALLIEPRAIQKDVYMKIEKNYKRFKYVFTHDSKLLNILPNAKPIIWGGCWCHCDKPNKNKFMGMICSHKMYTELHRVRMRTALKFKDRDNFDLYGPFNDGQRIDPMVSYENYKYVVIVENQIDDIWITEKVIDAFATKCIPIYLGARKISDYFNSDSIIQVNDEKELNDTIEFMLNNKEFYDDFYNDKNIQMAIEDNYERSKKYWSFEEWFYNKYDKEIGGMFND